jgi:hypothetical protein
MLDSLRQIPGVASVAATSDPELKDTNISSNITVAGYAAKEEEDMNVEQELVSPGYLSTLGMTLIAGRGIGGQDGPDAPPVAVVNESFAKHWLGGADHAVGRQFRNGAGTTDKNTRWFTIVGVVKDAKHTGVRDEVVRTAFYSYLQAEPWPGMLFYLRTRQQPEAALADVRQTMQRLDPKLVPQGLKTMDAQIGEDLDSERTLSLRRELRRARRAAGGDRPLRNAGLRHRAAPARDRHSHGPRLDARRSREARSRRSRQTTRGQHGGRSSRRADLVPADQEPALRSHRARSARAACRVDGGGCGRTFGSGVAVASRGFGESERNAPL